MCLPCGFHSEKKPCDPVPCAHRDNGTHKGLCKHCDKTEKMLLDIIALATENYNLPRNTLLQKDLAAEEIKWFMGYQDTICSYRSHIARCIAEQRHVTSILSNLTPAEALLVFDFKQKVNSAGYKETQVEYYGKAGVICFGVMEMRLMDNEDDMLEVVFTMYVSDDKTQDFGFVSQAIHHYLSAELPECVKSVHFDSDGAGVFSSSKMKALIVQWSDWVGIQVKSLHISVAGDGKDNLDGKFGQIGIKIRIAIKSGSSFHDAKTLAELLVSDGGIKATSIRIFTPSRQVEYDFDDSICKLSDFHTITVEPGGIRCYYISGYGPGHFFPLETVVGGWKSCCCAESDGCLIEPKNYDIEDPSSTDNDGVQVYSLEKSMIRKEKKITDKLSSQNLSTLESNEARLKDLRKKGIFPCPIFDKNSLSYCTCEYQSSFALEKHLTEDNHKFASMDARSRLLVMSSNGFLCRGSRPNRAFEASSEAADTDVDKNIAAADETAFDNRREDGSKVAEAVDDGSSVEVALNADTNIDAADDAAVFATDDSISVDDDNDVYDEDEKNKADDYGTCDEDFCGTLLAPLVSLGCRRSF
uniref:Uncharacterized protein n=1 Tax=Leptocylindrus danicus TaxID=163516 RepID=A0A7S2KBE3_9STRA|mmetsp:Transcript_20872/g.31114  ORF Transcript_20872/g.31114 Transcript_20872/m.31114 type:complete len:585 (+) Transcript_20872:389-2143(+)